MSSPSKSEQYWAKSEQAERSAAEAKDPMAKSFLPGSLSTGETWPRTRGAELDSNRPRRRPR